MRVKNPRQAESHFEFGKNWSDYSRLIDGHAVIEAEKGILSMMPAEKIRGASWLDIGSGSGIHSLAAHRLGATEITAVDIDNDSVETTRRVLARHGVQATVERMSVFNLESLGQFDIVYAWGVLHHTGDMWEAVRCAANRVRPGGLLAIALYQKTQLCGAWLREKKWYTSASEPMRMLARGLYISSFIANTALSGRNPLKQVREYKTFRGMSFRHDVHDWLGGYPYESSSVQETNEFVSRLGFTLLKANSLRPGRGVFGTGCAEYVYRKNG